MSHSHWLAKKNVLVQFEVQGMHHCRVTIQEDGEVTYTRLRSIQGARVDYARLLKAGFIVQHKYQHYHTLNGSWLNCQRKRRIDTEGATEVTREELWQQRHRRTPSKLKATIMEILRG